MAAVLIVASLLTAACWAVWVIRRRAALDALDHIRVSRQWLLQHQADDRS